MEFTKEAYVARQSLKTKRVWRPSEADCQNLTSSESLKIIKSWSSSESEDWNQQLVKVCYSEDTSLQKEHKLGATTISEELEGIECLSIKEHMIMAIVQLYNHWSTLLSAYSTSTVVSTLVNSPYNEWIWNYFLLEHQPNQATDHWWWSSFNNDSLDVLPLLQRIFHTSI